jgi:NADPH:quinone reductase-like Zn-dependent oxidoreductase
MVKSAGADEVSDLSDQVSSMLVMKPNLQKLVDYTAHQPLSAYFNETCGDPPFDSILDTVGSQELYTHSPGYLGVKGVYVNVGTLEDKHKGQTIWQWIMNTILPVFLGGVPRKFRMFGAAITPEGVARLAKAAEEGHIKVWIDSVFKMDDALAVCMNRRRDWQMWI